MSAARDVDALAHSILAGYAAGSMTMEEVAEAFDRAEALRPGLVGPMLFVGAIRHGAAALRRLAEATGQEIDELVDQDGIDLDFLHITTDPDGDR